MKNTKIERKMYREKMLLEHKKTLTHCPAEYQDIQDIKGISFL